MKKKILFYLLLFCTINNLNKLFAQEAGIINMTDSISTFDYEELGNSCIDAWFETYCRDGVTGNSYIWVAFSVNIPHMEISTKLDICHPRYHIATRTYLPKYDGIYRIAIVDSTASGKRTCYNKYYETNSYYTNIGNGRYYKDENCISLSLGHAGQDRTLIFKVYGGHFTYDTSGKPNSKLISDSNQPDVIRKIDLKWVAGQSCSCDFKEIINSDEINIIGVENKNLVDVKLNNCTLDLVSKKENKIHSVYIYDMYGMMVKSITFSNQSNTSIDLSNFKKSMYIVQSYTDLGFSTSKINLK